MAPLFILVTCMIIVRALGLFGVRALALGRDATRVGLVVMFLFTGATHFSGMKYDYAAMVPPPLTGQLWVIYLTGLCEVAGAIGLAIPRFTRMAGVALGLLLLAMFPANAYAALNGVQFRGAPPTDLWLRALVQIIFLAALWAGAIAPHHGSPWSIRRGADAAARRGRE